MNKTFIIIITFLFFLITCSAIVEKQKKNRAEENATEGSYKDGIYTEEGDIWKYGNENATVIIRNGRIKVITLRKLDNIGKEVNYEEWDSESKNSNKRPNLKKYRIDMAKRMVKKQTYEVEAVTGATISSENWKRAVKRALDKASR